jgi:GNAT superfamily N-acetyltransferase
MRPVGDTAVVPLDASWIGHRVVVRHLLDEPSPRASDVLGTLVAYDADGLAVLTDDADPRLVRVPTERLVTGKPVPPRASTLLRMSASRLEEIADAGWPPRTVQQLGNWRLREAGGFTGRANSVLPLGDPHMPLPEALAQVTAFYAGHGLPALIQVVNGSELEQRLTAAGWGVVRHQEGALVQVASLAQARRAARARARPESSAPLAEPPVELSDSLSTGWARLYGRTADAPADAVAHVLAGPEQVALASVGDEPIAIGRGVLTGDWLGLSAVEVVPSRRRAGLGRRVVDALLGWGAEQGARSVYLQTLPGNAAALRLYAPYGFVTHHRYRYWGPSAASSAGSDRSLMGHGTTPA